MANPEFKQLLPIVAGLTLLSSACAIAPLNAGSPLCASTDQAKAQSAELPFGRFDLLTSQDKKDLVLIKQQVQANFSQAFSKKVAAMLDQPCLEDHIVVSREQRGFGSPDLENNYVEYFVYFNKNQGDRMVGFVRLAVYNHKKVVQASGRPEFTAAALLPEGLQFSPGDLYFDQDGKDGMRRYVKDDEATLTVIFKPLPVSPIKV